MLLKLCKNIQCTVLCILLLTFPPQNSKSGMVTGRANKSNPYRNNSISLKL